MSLRGLRKNFSPERAALCLQSLDVRRGEFLAVVGPSGGGKTTLLNILAGFLKPDEGSVFKNGKPLPPPGPDRMPLFQNNALFPWYTALENVAYGLRMKDKYKRNARALEALELVGLAGAAKLYPAEMSGGMRQRAALARAIAPEPEILLLDEPFSALDEGNRRQLYGELLKLWRKYSPTIVMVTHNLEEAALLADRIALLLPPPEGLREILELDMPRPRNTSQPAAQAIIREIGASLAQT